ncbi:hypothetical protein [Pseudodesulfovibrio sp.]|uniref:hypothetical protein n=1 Tax=Pseudodesulfovibrio sp. TaxID=2035812 RepID=UPI00261760FD|nr:hypothetical protein [Pseudodesulfovibrio sp.]MDD3311770.1 hypothetical protein [Pseudodesulfovibrio sp.]
MSRHPHTTDEHGFDFMANTGREEQDRDCLGILFALAVMACVTVSQYLGLL